MGPINDGMGLNITVMSYMGSIFFGLVACRETVPEVQRIADFLGDALEELLKAANEIGGTKSTVAVAASSRPPSSAATATANVPGPNFPLYSSGARMVAIYPMGPINDGMGLNMTVMSYMGSIFFGLIACRETVPQVQRIADFIGDALAELLKAANAVAGSTGAGSGATPASAATAPAGQATTPAPAVAAAKPTTKTEAPAAPDLPPVAVNTTTATSTAPPL